MLRYYKVFNTKSKFKTILTSFSVMLSIVSQIHPYGRLIPRGARRAARPIAGQERKCLFGREKQLRFWFLDHLEMSTDQKKCGGFAVAGHAFSLFGRRDWFEGSLQYKTCGGELVEVRTEHAVIISNPATNSMRVR